jgi:putative oxidoreductase
MATIGRFMTGTSDNVSSFGILVLRVIFGGFMAIGHGWQKIQTMGGSPSKFPDPLGIGNVMSFYGAVGAEFVCSLLLVLGLFTRLACLPLLFTMGVAFLVVHRNDALFMAGGAAKEPAILYFAAYLAVLLLGPGRFSLDHALFGKASKPSKSSK